MTQAAIQHPLHVKVEKYGQCYWVPTLEIHKRYVLTKMGRFRYADVHGYRLPWTGHIEVNAHFIIPMSRGGFFG